MKYGNTALIRTVVSWDKRRQDIVEWLLKHGADVNVANKNGRTALLIATSYDDVNAVRLLLNCGADVNVADEDGETAFMLATENENKDILVLFLNHGADVNTGDK